MPEANPWTDVTIVLPDQTVMAGATDWPSFVARGRHKPLAVLMVPFKRDNAGVPQPVHDWPRLLNCVPGDRVPRTGGDWVLSGQLGDFFACDANACDGAIVLFVLPPVTGRDPISLWVAPPICGALAQPGRADAGASTESPAPSAPAVAPVALPAGWEALILAAIADPPRRAACLAWWRR